MGLNSAAPDRESPKPRGSFSSHGRNLGVTVRGRCAGSMMPSEAGESSSLPPAFLGTWILIHVPSRRHDGRSAHSPGRRGKGKRCRVPAGWGRPPLVPIPGGRPPPSLCHRHLRYLVMTHPAIVSFLPVSLCHPLDGNPFRRRWQPGDTRTPARAAVLPFLCSPSLPALNLCS